MDTHKDTLAVALVDESGRSRAAITITNSEAGHAELVLWLQEHGPVQRFGIEGAGGYGRAVALRDAGIVVVEVPPALTMRERHRSRQGEELVEILSHAARDWTTVGYFLAAPVAAPGSRRSCPSTSSMSGGCG
jgi:transposase